MSDLVFGFVLSFPLVVFLALTEALKRRKNGKITLIAYNLIAFTTALLAGTMLFVLFQLISLKAIIAISLLHIFLAFKILPSFISINKF